MKKLPKHLIIYFWSRKFHIHLGLFLILFIWLFSISGLLLNHGDKWKFASFWKERKEKTSIIPVLIYANADSASMINNIMQQLNISGEVSEVRLNGDSLNFRVSRPGHERNIHVDFKNRICRQKELSYNLWGKLRTLHTFNGMDEKNPEKRPNWIIAGIWQFTMDVVASGIIVLLISSWIMWFKLNKSDWWGTLFLITGFVIVIYYVFALKLL